jgi:PAS domain S-box-containing protein
MANIGTTLLWVQVGSAAWLASILLLVYLRVYREPALRYWSISFAVLAVSLVWQLVMPPHSPEQLLSWPSYLLGMCQYPLIVLAAINLKPPFPSRRRQMLLLAGLVAGALVLSLATCSLPIDRRNLPGILRFERQLEAAAAAAWFCIAFLRKHYLARTVGGWTTVVFTALYAVRHVVLGVAAMAFPPLRGGYFIAGGVSGAIMPMGIAAGLVVLASEALIATSRRLRDSEERYRTLVEASPDAILATDPGGTIRMCNRRTAEILGYASSAELGGMPAMAVVAPADRERVRAEGGQAMGAGRLVSLECRILLRGGEERCAELTAAPLRSGEGAITGTVAILHDVTKRKEADRALRREREFSAHVIDAIPGSFFVLDRQGNRLRWNRSRERAGSARPRPVRGFDGLARFHPEDRRRVADSIEAVFTKGSAETEARSYVGRGGEVRHFYLTGRRMEADGVAYLVGCAVDITGRKEAEAARARLETQLAQSQRLESIGRLAGGVAHDFNNHLTVINGYCDLIVSGLTPDDPNRECLLDVRQAGERAAALTRQLLAFGRKQFLSPRPVSLNRIVTSMETMLGRLLPENIAVAARLAPGLGAAMADTGQIEQVLMNLVVNARDAMPGGGRILIETANVDLESATGDGDRGIGPGAYVSLTVTDTGVGMDDRTRALIFEPFFTTKQPGQGTGLGLATVHGIANQSGGAITVRSQPGEGSAFTVYLPRLDAQAVEAPPEPAARGSRQGRGTILLVEDQQPVREMVSRVLRLSGYSVLPAGDGSQALALVDSQVRSVDLLVTDMVMPGMSGRELAARLTARQGGLRVLFMSGYAPHAVPDGGDSEPGVEFLQKPFSPSQLTARVDEILAGK